MKILVLSDSHGDYRSLEKIMSTHRDYDVVIHCGDTRDEMDRIKTKYKDKIYYEVKGNCDLGSYLPTTLIETIGGLKFFITHGHHYQVKYTLNNIFYAAKEQDCDFILFGHTHCAENIREDNLYIMNPGSCYGTSGTYGTIEIFDQHNVLTNIAKISSL